MTTFSESQDQIPSKAEWTEPEKWVWEKLCKGEAADFNFKFNNVLDTKSKEGWNDERVIRPEFLETILLEDTYCKMLHRNGLSVSGAYIKERLNFRNAKIYPELNLTKCRFEEYVDFTHLYSSNSISLANSAFSNSLIFMYAKIDSYLNLIGVKVAEELNLNSLSLGSSLFMREGGEFKNVILNSSKINGNMEISGSMVSNKLDMNSIYVGNSLFMTGLKDFFTEFKEVVMIGAKIEDTLVMDKTNITELLNISSTFIGSHLFMQSTELNQVIMRNIKINGQLNMVDAKVRGSLEMSSITIGDLLNMRGNAEFNSISMIGLIIHGQVDMTEAKFNSNVYLDSITIDKSVFLRPEKIAGTFSFILSKINGSVYIANSEISQLDFGGTHILGELHIGSIEQKIKWTQNSFMNLRNTVVGALMDAGENSWPGELNFDGFTYSRLGGLFGKDEPLSKQIAERDSKWFTEWMEKDKSYSPQPYHHLADVLAKMGYPDKSNAVLYAAKNRERNEAKYSKLWKRWWGLSLLKWTIGYGYGGRYFRSLIWVFCLTIIGVMVLSTLSSQSGFNSVWDKIGFSVDMLLPIISLDNRYDLNFSGWQLYYFYFHKLMGFLLGSFVVAGLSGITKK